MSNELAKRGENALTELQGLAVQARNCVENIAENTLKLGEILASAKVLVKHGEWENWVLENTNFSVRTAQQFIQAYNRFGHDSKYASIERGKIISMGLLPAGTEDAFVEEHDISAMTAREVKKAVEAERARFERELQAARNEKGIPDDIRQKLTEQSDTIEKQKAEMERLKVSAQESVQDAFNAIAEKQKLEKENEYLNGTLEELNGELQDTQERLANAQSVLAKGDAERKVTSQLSADAFAYAVKQFIGTCAQMPHMSGEFSMMPINEKNEYDRMLKTVEAWCKSSRKAISAVGGDGDVK